MSPILEKTGIYAHKDADKAGHKGHDTDKETKEFVGSVVVSCVSVLCPRLYERRCQPCPSRRISPKWVRSKYVVLQSQSVSHGHVPDSLD